jgi:hypothetical protein
MTDISRDDFNRLHSAIDGVRQSVGESEIRLGARIDAQRLESDKIYVREDRIKLVEKDVATLTKTFQDFIDRQDWWKKALIVEALAIVGAILVAVLQANGAL